jgi:hypothetical protein
LGTRQLFKNVLDFVGIEDRRCHNGMGILVRPEEEASFVLREGWEGWKT